MDLRPLLIALGSTCAAACGASLDEAQAPAARGSGGPPEAPGRASDESAPPTARMDTVQMLLEGRDHPRHESDGGGRAWIETEDGAAPSAQAGVPGRWTLVYEAGPLGVAEGGLIQVVGPLQAGAKVVVRGNERLMPGQPVRVLAGS